MAQAPGTGTRRIQKLDEAVVNRIAAGEVIQRPANALKELLENSLDAKSTTISVVVKEGGLKLLQIQDNGCGIGLEDLPIVCERFTTSKLQSFDDLKSISTFGFRGEALASISHVAHVSILTKTVDAKCAYKAHYADGKLIPGPGRPNPDPVACAGIKGTTITVEDLFFNVATRRKALKNASDEYSRVSDVVARYAIHNAGVAFSLKKHGDTSADVRTMVGASKRDNIKALFGAQVERELLDIKCDDERLSFSMSGVMTNANFSVKKGIYLFFINNRLVDCPSIKKATELIFSAYLPKQGHPFVYMSIVMNPMNLDVNVHPTKQEVHFLHEDQIVEKIQKAVEDALLGANASRTFYTQSLLPGVSTPKEKEVSSKAPFVYEHQMVRTDSRARTLESFAQVVVSKTNLGTPVPRSATSTSTSASTAAVAKVIVEPLSAATPIAERKRVVSDVDGDAVQAAHESKQKRLKEVDEPDPNTVESCKHGDGTPHGHGNETISAPITMPTIPSRPVEAIEVDDDNEDDEEDIIEQSVKHSTAAVVLGDRRKRRRVLLTSILQMREEVKSLEHKGIVGYETGLRDIFAGHKFVGVIKPSLALVQHQTDLYLMNTSRLSKELFYQVALQEFSNFGRINLHPAPALYDLFRIALDNPQSDGSGDVADMSKDDQAKYYVNFISERKDMLSDYFALGISEDKCLTSLPVMLQHHLPDMIGLPMFLMRLALNVNWDEEEPCLRGIARELSEFYAIGGHISASTSEDKTKTWQWIVEHVIYPAFKSSMFAPPTKFTQDRSVLKIASLPELYKVFERC